MDVTLAKLRRGFTVGSLLGSLSSVPVPNRLTEGELRGCQAPDRTARRPAATRSARRTSLTRGRPCGSPAVRSCSSIACQPSHVTASGARAARRRRRRSALAVEHAGLGVLDDLGHRVGGVLLVGADHAARPALDPADRVLAAMRDARLVAHAAAVVADQPARGVEGHVADGPAGVADRAEHEPAADDLLLAGRRRRGRPRSGCGRRAGRSPLVAEDLDRRAPELQADAPAVGARARARRRSAGSRRCGAWSGPRAPRRPRARPGRPARRRRSSPPARAARGW